jgi:triphosphoribosyl-dephospho-CoA synthase
MPTTGLCAQLACIWEVTACKPGNVTRYYDFEKTTFVDFLLSAAAVGPVLETAPGRRVGETVLEGIRATRQVVNSNTNLGILLLLAPLAAIPRDEPLQFGLPQVLDRLDVEDTKAVYEAIRLAEPGGLGQVAEQDVHMEPSIGLREAMRLAADRDLIARQYVNNFSDVFNLGVPGILSQLKARQDLESAIVYCHLKFMATYPDSLIARKCGLDEAREVQRWAKAVLDAGWPGRVEQDYYVDEVQVLDERLRADGNKRNPGTSADLVTASLFALLREGTIESAFQYPWNLPAGDE